MDEHDLMEALEDRVADVPVGPAPVDAMTRTAGRTRRRRGLLGGVAAAAVVVVATVGVVRVLPGGSDPGDGGRDVAVQPAAVDVPPDGSTYVGMGDAAIAVPQEWPRDDTECNGVPRRSTVVVDPPLAMCFLYSAFPADSDAVFVSMGDVDTSTWTPTSVDGAEALRSPDETSEPDPASGGGTVHGASIHLPDSGVTFRVQSSVSAERVDELLDGIVVLDEHAAVPGFADLSPAAGDSAYDAYLERLDAAELPALRVDRVDRTGLAPGTVLSVDPVPGTLLPLGTAVTVTIVR